MAYRLGGVLQKKHRLLIWHLVQLSFFFLFDTTVVQNKEIKLLYVVDWFNGSVCSNF